MNVLVDIQSVGCFTSSGLIQHPPPSFTSFIPAPPSREDYFLAFTENHLDTDGTSIIFSLRSWRALRLSNTPLNPQLKQACLSVDRFITCTTSKPIIPMGSLHAMILPFTLSLHRRRNNPTVSVNQPNQLYEKDRSAIYSCGHFNSGIQPDFRRKSNHPTTGKRIGHLTFGRY